MALEVKHIDNFGVYLIDEQGVVAECIYEIVYTLKRLISSSCQTNAITFTVSKREFEQKNLKLDGNKVVGLDSYYLGGANLHLLRVEVKNPNCRTAAKKLVEKLVEIAKEQKCKEIYGTLTPSAEKPEENYELYLDMGFKIEKKNGENRISLDPTKHKEAKTK